MTPVDRSDILAKAQAEVARIAIANNQENLDRLRAEFEQRGWKLTGTLKNKSSFTLRDPNGASMTGLNLADVGSLLVGTALQGK